MKRFLLLNLILILLFPCTTSAFASPSASSLGEDIDNSVISDDLHEFHIVLDQEVVSNGTRAWYDFFDTTDEDPSYRIDIENTGVSSIRVYVKRGDVSSNDIMAGPMTIAPGDEDCVELTTDNDGNHPGRRWLVIDPVAGEPFEATLCVRIAPSFDELD